MNMSQLVLSTDMKLQRDQRHANEISNKTSI